MTIDYLGIRLHQLRTEHLEMLRGWRNEKSIRAFMHSKEYITAQMQQDWFATISNKNHLYLIIELNDEMIGTIYLKDIDIEKGDCEGGILAKPDHISTIAPAVANICMIEIAYYLYGLKTVRGHTFQSNTKVISNYKRLGFEVVQSLSDELTLRLEIKKPAYQKRRGKLLAAVNALFPNNREMIITMNQEDAENEVSNYIRNKLILDSATSSDERIKITLMET